MDQVPRLGPVEGIGTQTCGEDTIEHQPLERGEVEAKVPEGKDTHGPLEIAPVLQERPGKGGQEGVANAPGPDDRPQGLQSAPEDGSSEDRTLRCVRSVGRPGGCRQEGARVLGCQEPTELVPPTRETEALGAEVVWKADLHQPAHHLLHALPASGLHVSKDEPEPIPGMLTEADLLARTLRPENPDPRNLEGANVPGRRMLDGDALAGNRHTVLSARDPELPDVPPEGLAEAAEHLVGGEATLLHREPHVGSLPLGFPGGKLLHEEVLGGGARTEGDSRHLGGPVHVALGPVDRVPGQLRRMTHRHGC